MDPYPSTPCHRGGYCKINSVVESRIKQSIANCLNSIRGTLFCINKDRMKAK